MKKDCLCYQGLNEDYFDLLLEKHRVGQKGIDFKHIHPVSVASTELLKELPISNYEELKNNKDEFFA